MPPTPESGPNEEQREHDLTMHIFTILAGLVGVCLTAIGLLLMVAVCTMGAYAII